MRFGALSLSLSLALVSAWPVHALAERTQKTVVVPANELHDAAARRVIRIGRRAIARHGSFHLALSGGSTPKALHQRLASPEMRGQLDWSKVHIYFGDERAVPPAHQDSNFKMAKDTLLDHVPIPGRNVHRIRGEWEPGRAARAYSRLLAGRRLDLVILGMGGDGHTASLFPGMDLGHRELVVPTLSPAAPSQRVSLSLKALNRAESVMFLVSGAEKAGRVAEVHGGGSSLPAAQVRPSGTLRWFLDEPAASGLRSADRPPGHL
jgi:6-phosphogluconolactonase